MQATARKPSTCSRCHAPGHNVTTCSQADPSQLVVAVTGFDPGTGIVNVLAYGGGTGPVRTYLPPRIDPRLYLGRSMPITVHSITQLAELYAAARHPTQPGTLVVLVPLQLAQLLLPGTTFATEPW